MMNRYLIISGLILLFGACISGADLISSSISSTGSSWIQSSLSGDNAMYSGTFFTTDPATVLREIMVGRNIRSGTSVNSSGSFGLDEFSGRSLTGDPYACLIIREGEDTGASSGITTSGLFRSGRYDSLRVIGEDETISRTLLNGSGMVSLGKRKDKGNFRQEEEAITSGKMNVSEFVRFGEEKGWRI